MSYAREDAAVVTEGAADLRALDHEAWLDQDLGGGIRVEVGSHVVYQKDVPRSS